MTREQKIEWTQKASNKELVEQLRWAVTFMNSDNIEIQIDGNESYEIITKEILCRMK